LKPSPESLPPLASSFDRPVTRNEKTGDALAFIYDPWGAYIELNDARTR
jgi:hypothetical protein